MLLYVTLDHVAGQDAHDYRLRPSRGKPPFNTNESSIAVIFDQKSMPLRYAELNVIVTSYGCWPAERIFLNEFAVLQKNVKKADDWLTVSRTLNLRNNLNNRNFDNIISNKTQNLEYRITELKDLELSKTLENFEKLQPRRRSTVQEVRLPEQDRSPLLNREPRDSDDGLTT